ncbi:MAG TPA: hypothetical protein DDZ89_17865 [Clostridiales bacterium]|nr:hypothetical protein [Clostridiales bacterium]
MELSDIVNAVSKIQGYFNTHFDGEITLEALSSAAGYSKYHTVRMFEELTGKTPFETIRTLRQTKSAQPYRPLIIRLWM